MMIKALITPICLLAVLVGCSGNATNEPTVADIQKANDNRAAAIDNDPKLNAEQKAKMKEMMGLSGSKPGR